MSRSILFLVSSLAVSGLAVGEELPLPPPSMPAFQLNQRAPSDLVPINDAPAEMDDHAAETIFERYPDRSTKIERQVVQDEDRNFVNHGSWRFFDQQGRVVAEGEYRSGKRHGSWMRTHANWPISHSDFQGPYMSQAEFRDDQLHGTWSITDSQHRIVASWEFERGKLHGTAATWFNNSQPQQQMHFVDGRPDGEAVTWTENGRVSKKDFYARGTQLIPVVTWHDQQQKRYEGWVRRSNFDIAVEVDWWNGLLQITRVEKEGEDQREGKWTEWHANGTIRYEGVFENGRRVGEHTWWHENGQKQLTGQFDRGMQEGLWTSWHVNGRKHEEGAYLAGTKQGEWTVWTDAGQIAQVQNMDDLGSASESILAEDRDLSPPHNVTHVSLD